MRAELFLVFLIVFANCFIRASPSYSDEGKIEQGTLLYQGRIRTLPSSTYYDKALGSWIGQMIGNILGLPTEGNFIEKPSPEHMAYYSQIPSGAFTDDDTSMEWVFLHMLEKYGLEITYLQIRDEWIEHINGAIWLANARARELMGRGYVPPDTGSKENNEYWGSIDAQIECEIFGVICPGMISKAYEMAKFFAKVTNDDYAAEAAAFYAAMFSCAFFESDVSLVVRTALTKVSKNSLTWEVISDVIRWHEEIENWKETREKIWEKYGSYGWTSSPLNLAAVVMAVLYGNGDFDYSLMIANSAGWDNDCNAATVGGLLGLIVGEKGINKKWKEPLMDTYRNINRDGMPASETISEIAIRTQKIAEKTIIKYGGSIIQQENERTYIIETEIPYAEPSNSFSDENLARKRFSTPICCNRPFTKDFLEVLNIMRDGITAKQNLRSFNVRGEDWWGYTFEKTLKINRLVYYQGEAAEGSGWKNLIVQYRDNMGRWINVSGLEMNPNYYEENSLISFKRFVLKFNTIIGTGIRIYGEPKFSYGHTSIAELEVFYRKDDWREKPSPPTDLRALLLHNGSILLEWIDNSNNEFGFKIFRRGIWQKNYEEVIRVGTGVCKFIDSQIQPLELYCYIVAAENDDGLSDFSNEVIIFSWPPLFGRIENSALIFLIIITTVMIIAFLIKNKKLKIEIIKEPA